MNENKGFTPLSALGEFGLIDLLTKDIVITNESSVKGVGDDAAVLDYKEKQVVVTTDMLMEGIHFNLMYTPLKHLGYKAIIVNLSDVYAMNGIPRQVVVSVAVSSKFAVEHLKELYEGIDLACREHGVDLVGGDTTSSLTGLAISVTAMGEVAKERVVYRTGAQKNDLICVSGNLGAAYLGLQILERENKIFSENNAVQPELKGYDYVLARQLKPAARGDIVRMLEKNNLLPTAMIDISDGLSSELLHICNKSDAGCAVYLDKLPFDQETLRVAEELNLDPTTCALNGGEDYELLFTANLSDYDLLAAEPSIRIIGHITDKAEGTYIIAGEDKKIPLTAQGWNPVGQDK